MLLSPRKNGLTSLFKEIEVRPFSRQCLQIHVGVRESDHENVETGSLAMKNFQGCLNHDVHIVN